MNETEVQRQIEQMVRFIKQEADEKASEIRLSADEEFNLEKLQVVEAEKQKIRKEFERKEAQVDVTKKIESSKLVNEQRLKVLAARQEACNSVILDAKHTISSVVKGQPQVYKKIMTDLLVQAIRAISEPSVVVKCRECDLSMVKGILPDAGRKYQQVFSEPPPEIKLSEKNFLPPPAKNDEQENDPDHPTCLGGLAATSVDGRIVCSNTFDDRLNITYQQNLPIVRGKLFGFIPPVRG